MVQNQETALQTADALDSALAGYALPKWEDFPDLPLYMDQVVYLLNQYLSLGEKQSGERLVTPAMINNYVKLKIIPPPVKKKYGKTHLAYLVMVFALKQSVSVGGMNRLLPLGLEETETQRLYASFLDAFGDMKESFRTQARAILEPLREGKEGVGQMVFRAAALSRLFQHMTDQLLPLCQEEAEEE